MSESSEKLGLATCVTILIGGMVGSAIFSLSGMTVYTAGPSAVVSWALAGFIMLSYGLITAELAVRFPKSGGVFVFPSRAIGGGAGNVWGWISTWAFFNANTVAIAFSAIYVAIYLGVGFPAAAGLQVPLALATIALCFLLNIVRFSVTGKANSVLVVFLAATLVIFIIAAFTSGAWDSSLFVPFWTQGAGGKAGFLAATPVAMVAYGTIVAVAFIVSEVKNPQKNVPRSMLVALCVVMTLYILVIVATVGLVSAAFLEQNPGMRYIPLYAACFTKLAAIPWLAKIVSVSATLALFTTALIVMALTTRAVRAVSEAGLLPKALAASGKSGSPVPAAVLTAVLSGAVSCFPQFTNLIVNYGALFATVTIVVNCVSLLYARRGDRGQGAGGSMEEGGSLPPAPHSVAGTPPSAGAAAPATPPPFRAPLGQALPVITMIVLVVCYLPGIRSGGWRMWAYTAISYIVGFLIFAVMSAKSRK